MVILLVVEAAGAGVGRHVVDLALGLARAEHRVRLVYSPLRMDADFARGVEALCATGAAVSPLPMRREPGPWDIPAALALRRIIRDQGPFDVIHGHSSKAGALARLAALGLPGVRVYTPHALFTMDPGLGRAARWAFGSIERILDVVGDAVILVSPEEERHALLQGLAPERLFVVPNGIDLDAPLDRPGMRRRFGLREGQLAVGFVGRLSRQKAPENLLRAFALLAPRAPEARLVMVGDGPLGAPLRAEALGLGLQGRVVWAGTWPGHEAMAGFDVFALPSRYEGLPYSLLEAMTAGLPTAMTAVGGAGSLVADGRHGLVVPVGDHRALAAALLRLIEDPELRRRMGADARARVREFSVEKMVSRTLDVYGALLSRLRASER